MGLTPYLHCLFSYTPVLPFLYLHLCTNVCVFLGAVPVPESLLLSQPPLVPLQSVSTEQLLGSISPAEVEELRRTCKGSIQCVHDTLASGSSDQGLQTLDAKKQYENLALIFGKMATLVCFYLFFFLFTCANLMW